MGVSREQAQKAAVRYLVADGFAAAAAPPPDVVPQRLDACAAHLVTALDCAPDEAADLALLAWAELQGARAQVHFDLRASTPHLVFLIDRVTGQRRAVSSTDLLRLIGPREVKPIDRPVS